MKTEPRISASEVHKLARKATPHVLMAVPSRAREADEALTFARQLREHGNAVGLLTRAGGEGAAVERLIKELQREGCTRYEMGRGPKRRAGRGDTIEKGVPFPYLRNQINRLVVEKDGKRVEHVVYTPIVLMRRKYLSEGIAAGGIRGPGGAAPESEMPNIDGLKAQGPKGSVPRSFNSAFGDGANVLAAGGNVYIVSSSVKDLVKAAGGKKNPPDELLETAKDGSLRFHGSARRRFGVPNSEFVEMPAHAKSIYLDPEGHIQDSVDTTDLDMFMMPLRESGKPVFLRDESLAERHPDAVRKLDEKMKSLGYKVVVVPWDEERFCPSCGLEAGGEFFTNPRAKRTIQRLKDAGVRAVPAASPFEQHLRSAAGYHCVTH